ncbi:hypothetical protein C8P68_10711 [Mucilaginibacter yixingensis]|uniref:Uncharacterized protein n=1 Tax=Mucilaginibacter yixingensis TaxID=1295612 RepID=A0A2T5J5Z4_9SPHI|nr:hypothetical protein [Mucilaginibacter yixingensis]PTQ93954.1 hypothetical protein C8P68_10711 [Mucilaginibacter yixingensis]
MSTVFYRYYRVFKNDTAVTEVPVNNFKPFIIRKFKRGLPTAFPVGGADMQQFYYALPPDDSMFYGYLDKAHAMEKAKAGALVYIYQMIGEVELGIKKLTQYRDDHYEDLNINLLDAQIRKLKKDMNTK